MRFIKLLTPAYVGGVLRHPSEGVIHTETDEATKLFAAAVAVDVTDDFTPKQNEAVPVEHIAARGGMQQAPSAEHPHQSEVAPQQVHDVPEEAPVVDEPAATETAPVADEPSPALNPEAEPAAEAAPKSRARRAAASKE